MSSSQTLQFNVGPTLGALLIGVILGAAYVFMPFESSEHAIWSDEPSHTFPTRVLPITCLQTVFYVSAPIWAGMNFVAASYLRFLNIIGPGTVPYIPQRHHIHEGAGESIRRCVPS